MSRLLVATLFACVSLAGCGNSSTDTAPAVLVIDPGLEATLGEAPTTSRLLARVRMGDGSEKPVFDGALPADRRIQLGEVSTGTAVSFIIEGRDDAGNVVLRGGTPFIYPAGDIPVLVGRPSSSTRLRLPLAAPATAGTLVGARYLFAAADSKGTLFDLARLDALSDARGLPRPVRTLLSWQSIAVLIDQSGASSVDTTTGEAGINSLGGAAAADVVDGAVVVGTDGTYLVGAGRAAGAKTSTVVRFASNAQVVTLTQPRIAAAAGWIDGTGLVVTGGETDGLPEIIAAGATAPKLATVSLPARRGGVLAPLSDGAFVLLGGVDPATGKTADSLRVALACAASCVAPLAAPVDLVSGKAHAAGAGRAFVVGPDAAGWTRAYLVDGSSITKVELRADRRGGDSVAVGDGFVVVLGGTDAAGAPLLGLEQLTP